MKLRESKLLKLYQHKGNPEFKLLAKPAINEDGMVKVLIPCLRPGGEYLMRHMWSKAPDIPHEKFTQLYEPVLLNDTDEETRLFARRILLHGK